MNIGIALLIAIILLGLYFWKHPAARQNIGKNIAFFSLTFIIGMVVFFQESLAGKVLENGNFENILSHKEAEAFVSEAYHGKALYSWYGASNFVPAIFVVYQDGNAQRKVIINAFSGEEIKEGGSRKNRHESLAQFRQHKQLQLEHTAQKEAELAAQAKAAKRAAKEEAKRAAEKAAAEEEARIAEEKEREEQQAMLATQKAEEAALAQQQAIEAEAKKIAAQRAARRAEEQAAAAAAAQLAEQRAAEKHAAEKLATTKAEAEKRAAEKRAAEKAAAQRKAQTRSRAS